MTKSPTGRVSLLALAREVDPQRERDLGLKAIKPEDNVIGAVSEELQRIWMACRDLAAEAINQIEELRTLDREHSTFHSRKCCNRKGCSRLLFQIEGAKARALEAEEATTHAACAFWSLATLELGVWEQEDQELALREGFVIVLTDDVDEEPRRQMGWFLEELNS